MRIIDLFKYLFFLGLILLLFSCFVEWYSVKIINSSGEIVVWWKYQLFYEWTTPLSDSYNDSFRPNSSLFPLSINIVLIVLIIFSGYIVFFNNIEKITSDTIKMLYTYGIMALPMLVIYYIWIFPWYLGGLYYPTITVTELITGFRFVYSIELGNILAIASFPMIFPYSFFYFVTGFKFERKDNSPENKVHELIQNTQEELDLDGLIATEEIKMLPNKPKNRLINK